MTPKEKDELRPLIKAQTYWKGVAGDFTVCIHITGTIVEENSQGFDIRGSYFFVEEGGTGGGNVDTDFPMRHLKYNQITKGQYELLEGLYAPWEKEAKEGGWII